MGVVIAKVKSANGRVVQKVLKVLKDKEKANGKREKRMLKVLDVLNVLDVPRAREKEKEKKKEGRLRRRGRLAEGGCENLQCVSGAAVFRAKSAPLTRGPEYAETRRNMFTCSQSRGRTTVTWKAKWSS